MFVIVKSQGKVWGRERRVAGVCRQEASVSAVRTASDQLLQVAQNRLAYQLRNRAFASIELRRSCFCVPLWTPLGIIRWKS